MHPLIPLDPALAEFIASRISIQVAACDETGATTLVRALGARVAEDRQRVTVLMARTQAEPVLKMLRANGRIAVVFSHPVNYRSIQLKGRDAALEAALPSDEAALPAYAQAMATHLSAYDVPESFTRAFLSSPPGDLIAVSFTPSEAYGQTPGPGAGARLAQEAGTP